ncbi:MAG: amine acid transporter, permease protein region, His/Glu/Gln/Arg/opine family [Xanthobacteraceae bacterium]|jgi:general L-amino acid transport system permease protein|nr:amine acid transporter, permease protein region, His/Glu/Gln/Arg/opine family [Xanthobacteraceae bacterium]
MERKSASGKPQVSLLYDRKVRSIAIQTLLCVVILFLVYAAATNAVDNLARAKIASGFGFWNNIAGFDISQTLIEYSSSASTYGQAFWVGLWNTLLVGAIGIVGATVIGFIVGIARLSRNLLVRRAASGYVEIVRNIPLLLQLLFWYNAVLKALPEMSNSLVVVGAYLNNRGLFLPKPAFGDGIGQVLIALAVGIAAAIAWRWFANRRQAATGKRPPVLLVTLVLVFGPAILAFMIMNVQVHFDLPQSGRFNIRGGLEVLPEFAALTFGLVIYTAAFIAEAVRAGISSVSRGQTEAALALGLRPRFILRLVVVPQAMRVIIPPLTNQYLNLVKNSTLAVAIGYPDLVQVFTGTVLNLTGQAVEVVAITMAVYLTISLTTSLLMNWYNARIALVER